MPNPVMRMIRNDLYEHGLSSGYLDQALVTLGRTLHDMSDALHRQKWISGPEFGLSDIALLAYIDRLERLGFEGLWTGSHAGIAGWLATMQARPSYAAEVSGKIPSDTAAAMRAEGAKFWPRIRDRI